MPTSGLWHLIKWMHFLALALWIGGIIFLAMIAAPAIHTSMASKAIAGDIVGRILKRFNVAELACCAVLILTSFAVYHFIPGYSRLLSYMMLAVFLMGLITAFYVFSLTPKMHALKEKVPTLEMLSSGHAVKEEFDRLHHLYVKLMSLNLVLGMGVLYVSVVVLK